MLEAVRTNEAELPATRTMQQAFINMHAANPRDATKLEEWKVASLNNIKSTDYIKMVMDANHGTS